MLLRKRVVTNLDNVLKSRNIILPTKVHTVKAIVSPAVMYSCESWNIKKAEKEKKKKAEHQRIDAFKLWCWRKLLRVPWRDWEQEEKGTTEDEMAG